MKGVAPLVVLTWSPSRAAGFPFKQPRLSRSR